MSTAELKKRLYIIIFEADTPHGKLFDVVLLWLILLSIAALSLETVESISESYGPWLYLLEWIITGIFTLEYILRILVTTRPLIYIRSFFGIIDLLSVLPAYVALFVASSKYLAVIRALRILRVFRVLNLTSHVGQGEQLREAMVKSWPKITVFTVAMGTLVLLLGTGMYVIEGPEHGFNSIPRSVYWAIVTLTTVGYGDITPHTTLGQSVSAIIMLLGYGIIAIPTGIVSVELAQTKVPPRQLRTCQGCMTEHHAIDARYCRHCGHFLEAE